jgi:tRNA pseudouridine55 synthase
MRSLLNSRSLTKEGELLMAESSRRDGLIPLDKPVGPTSHDIVAIVRRALGIRSVGHTGTLDPFASGLLLLCVGQSTRLAEYLGGWPKEYAARARLGVQTTTDDLQGEVLSESPEWEGLSRAEVSSALTTFLGESEQIPPDFSAKKVSGTAAYTLARRGKEVELPPSPIVVHSIEIIDVSLPWVDFRVSCSTGTYVRALARDLGERLGVGAHLTELRRLAIGPFHVDQAITLDDLSRPARLEGAWISPLSALADLSGIEVTEAEAVRIRMGQSLQLVDGRIAGAGEDREVALSLSGELVATAHLKGDTLRPRKVFQR